jgi:hypothetical protein
VEPRSSRLALTGSAITHPTLTPVRATLASTSSDIPDQDQRVTNPANVHGQRTRAAIQGWASTAHRVLRLRDSGKRLHGIARSSILLQCVSNHRLA